MHATVSSDGELELFWPATDDDHVDLVCARKGAVPNLALQVKTSFGPDGDGYVEARARFGAGAVREEPGFLYVVLMVSGATVEIAWVIPSVEFNRLAYRHQDGDWVELQLRARPAGEDRWSAQRVAPEAIGRRLLEAAAAAPAIAIAVCDPSPTPPRARGGK